MNWSKLARVLGIEENEKKLKSNEVEVHYQFNRRYIINGKKKSYRRTVRWTDCRHQ